MGGLRRLERLELGVMTHQAARSGDEAEVRRLVANGVNVDERDADGSTALHTATEHGHVEVMRALMELGADKEAKDADGETPLHWAADNGHVEAIKVLAQLGTRRRRVRMERRRSTTRQAAGTWRRSSCWLSSA